MFNKRLPWLLVLLLLTLATRAGAQGHPLPSGALAWWPGELNAQDVLGRNSGTVESTVRFAPGLVGQAFLFNGLGDGGGINLGNVAAFDFTPTSSFTLEAWINSSGATTGGNDGQTVILLNYNCGTPGTLQSLGIGAQEKVFFAIRDAGNTSSSVLSPAAPSKNAWHHIAGVREVTASGKVLKLYVNGVLVGTAADTSQGALAQNTADFIGRRILCGTHNTFKGLIDEPAVYGRALSAEEIAGIFRAGSTGKFVSRPPTLTSGAATTFVEGQSAVAVDPDLLLDNDEPMIHTAFVTLTNLLDAGQERLAADTAGTSILVSWAPPQLVFEGGGSVADFQRVLRSVTYHNASRTPNTSAQRQVEFLVRDASNESNRMIRRVEVVSVNDPPVAGDDHFTLVGNTLLQVDTAQGDLSVRTTTPSGRGLLDNDADPSENEPLTVVGIVGCDQTTAPFWCHTANGSLVTVQASGAFVFTPNPTDLAASDSFQYQVSDGTDTVTATATLERTGRVWYVENDYTDPGNAPPAGTSTQPFRTLAEAEAASRPGDTLYVFEGDGTATGQNAGITLKAGQRLIGAGHDLVMPLGTGTVTLRAAVTAPRVEHSAGIAVRADAMPAEIAGLALAGATDAVSLAAAGGAGAVLLQNLQLRAEAGAGLRVAGTGEAETRVSLSGGVILAQGGPAVDVQGAAIEIEIARLESLGSSGAGIRLVDAFGTFSAGADSRIEGSTGDAVLLEGGDGDFSFAGTISGGSSGHSVKVRGRSGGRLSFGGRITDNGRGIHLDGGGATSFSASFSGGLTLRPAAGASGFVAEGGGSVSVTGEANTVVAVGGGQALRVEGTAIGAAGLTFLSLSANGAIAGGGAAGVAGIHLENTGTAGGLTITGAGTAGSGGTLQGFGGAGIQVAGAGALDLSHLTLQSNAGGGIRGRGAQGLRLTGCQIVDNGGGPESSEAHGLDFENLVGAVEIAQTGITGGGPHGVRIANTEGVLSPFALSASQLTGAGGYGLLLEAHGTAAIEGVHLSGSTLAGSPVSLKLANSGSGRITGFTTTTTTFAGGATMDFSEAQMASLTCSP